MHPGPEQLVSHGAANEGGGDIVEKARDDEDHHQHHETALPVGGQKLRQNHRHVALFKMPGKQRKTGEQAEQIDDRHPFMTQVANEAGKAGAGLETGNPYFVGADREQAGQSNVQRRMVEQRNAEQGQRKEDEFDGNAADRRQIARGKSRQG